MRIYFHQIVQYDMKNLTDFPFKLTLTVEEYTHVSHKSLEVTRIAANTYLPRNTGKLDNGLKISLHPPTL